jgi:hypothetical protein
MLYRRLTCALLPLFAACNFDLSVPDTPQVGAVKGVLDITGHDELVGINVELVDDNGARTLQPIGADGSFHYDGIKPGSYYLVFDIPPTTAPPYTVPGIRVRAGLTFDVGTVTPYYPPVLTIVTGMVTVNGGGNPAGGEVDFLVEPSMTKKVAVIIGLDGSFITPAGVPQGTYTLRAINPLYITAELPHVVVAGPSLNLTMPITMGVNPATLTGSVTAELETPLPDGGTEQGVQNALVTLSNGMSVPTDVAGNFKLDGLAAGNQTVKVTLKDYIDPLVSHAVTLVPGMSTALDPVRLSLVRSSVTGTVSTADNQPATDITVALAGTSHGAVAVPDPANPAQARFEIPNVPNGTYDLRATKAHYTPATRPGVVVDSPSLSAAVQTVNSDLNNPPLVLTIATGDFVIDDGDATNTPGYTRTTSVTLQFAGLAGAAQIRASEDSAFSGVAYGAFTGTTLPFTLASNEGTHTVYAQYKDGTGVQSQVLSASIVLDTTAPAMPSIVINSGVPFTKTANPLFLTLQAFDALSGVAKVRLNENGMTTGGLLNLGALTAYQRDQSFTRSTSADGPQSVYAQFIDNAGNASPVVSSSITIDTVPPSGSLTIVDGPLATVTGFTNSPLVTLKEMAMAEPNGGSVLIKLANTQADLNTAVYVSLSATSTWFLDPSSDGLKTVYAMLQDAAGNTSGMFSAGITFDSTAPSPATATLLTPAITNDAGIVLSLAAMDNFGLSPTQAVAVSEDPFFQAADAGPFPANNKIAFTLSPQDGPKQVYVRYRDGAGNDTRTSVQVQLDTTPPSGSFTLSGTLADGTASSTVTSTAAITALIVQSGASAYFLVDEANTGVPAPCPASGYQMLTTSNVALNLSTAGARRVRLCLQDLAGNTLGPLTQVINYDGTAPSGCALALTGRKVDGSVPPAGKTATPSVTGSVTGCTETPTDIFITSNASVVCSSLASFAWQTYSASLPVLLPGPDGMNTMRGCVRDAAHNVGSLGAGGITLDTLPPQSPTVVLDNGAPYVNAAAVAMRGGNIAGATGTAVGASLWAVSATPTPGAFVAFTSPATSNVTFSPGDGPKTVFAYFQDDVGNTTVAVTANIVFDTAPPSTAAATVTVNPGGNGYTRITTVSLQLAAPSDATQMRIANAAGASCALTDFTGIPLQPFSAFVSSFGLVGVDGVKRVCVELDDAAGNPSSYVSGTITLDRVAPTGCALTLTGHKVDGSAAPAGKTASANVVLTVAGCGEVPTSIVTSTSALTCVTGNSYPWVPYASPLAFALSGPDGTNSAYACVIDAAGNVGTASSANITLDTQPPTAPSVAIEGGAQYINQATVTARGGMKGDVQGSAIGAADWVIYETVPGAFTALPAPSPNYYTFSGGDGVKTIHAVFRDDVGNATGVVTASIIFDTQPPTSLFTVTLQPGGNGYTNSVSVPSQLNGASGATQMQVGPAASSTGCVPGDLASVPKTPFTALPFNVLLPSGDGLKRECVMLWDDAGNSSPIASATITLDTTPPTVPAILNQAAIVNSPDNTAYVVTTGGSVSDTNFFRFEKLGGKLTSWTPDSTLPSTTTFQFNLVSDSTPNGHPNALRLRAVDLAGNTAESSVVITTDIVAPAPVTLNALWVSNGDRASTVYWTPGASTDVVGYNVYYGSSSGVYNGKFADTGASPFPISSVSRVTLSGLINSSPTYVTIKPVDHAGNEGPAPFSPSEVQVQPNGVSPDYMGSVAVAYPVHAFARGESTLYVLEEFSGQGIALQAIDLSGLVSPIQGGVPRTPTPPLPTATAVQTFNDGAMPGQIASLMDIQLDGRYLFTADSTFVRIFDVSSPLNPVLIDTLNAQAPAQALQVRGNTLFVAGTQENNCGSGLSGTMAIDLSALYDNNSATKPTLCGVAPYPACTGSNVNGMIGARGASGMCTGNPENGLLWSRSNVIQFETASTTWNVQSILNRVVPTFTLQGAQNDHTVGPQTYTNADGIAAGNLAFLPTSDGLQIVDLKKIWAGGAGSDWGQQTPLVYSGITGAYQTELLGAQMFLTDSRGSGFRTLQFDTFYPSAAGFDDEGLMRPPGNPGPIANYGNYLAVGDGWSVDLFEAATPRSVHQTTQYTLSGQAHQVVGGFIYGLGGVVDLMSSTQNIYPNLYYGCSWAQAYIDDNEISAGETQLVVTKFDNAIDRDPTTVFDSSQFYTIPMAANVFATGVASAGNYVVVAERRTSGTTGTYIEVLDARKLRGRVPGAQLCNATTPCPDSVGSLKVTANLPTSNPNGGRVDVQMYKGRAFVTLVDGAGMGIYIVDVRPAMDDDSTTTLGGILGTVTVTPGHTNPHIVTAQGHTLYFADDQDIEMFDITRPMSEPALALSGTETRTTLTLPYVTALAVYGSYLHVQAPSLGYAIYDISNPASPVVQSSTAFSTSGAYCGIGAGFNAVKGVGISVHGTRAYVTSWLSTGIFELE